MNTPNTIIGYGLTFPLNLNDKGTLQLDTGWTLISSNIRNLMAFSIGQRYFLGEFGASIKDMLEEQNDDISEVIIQHRLQTQLPWWDKRVGVNFVQIDRKGNGADSDNNTTVNVVVSIYLIGTDISETLVLPVTIQTVQ